MKAKKRLKIIKIIPKENHICYLAETEKCTNILADFTESQKVTLNMVKAISKNHKLKILSSQKRGGSRGVPFEPF